MFSYAEILCLSRPVSPCEGEREIREILKERICSVGSTNPNKYAGEISFGNVAARLLMFFFLSFAGGQRDSLIVLVGRENQWWQT
jgi:hypothetical protein